MPRKKEPVTPDSGDYGKRLTPESRENQLIALAYDLVEQRLRNGTATSQETTHFLKMGSTKERLEKQLIEEECKLKKAKIEGMESQKRIEALYEEAIAAVKEYRGYAYELEDIYEEDL